MPTLPGWAIDDGGTLAILAQARFDDEAAKVTGTRKNFVGKPPTFEHQLEFARARRIEMCAQTVDRNRQRRDAVRA